MKGRISSKCPPVVQHIKYAKKNVKNNLLEQMQEWWNKYELNTYETKQLDQPPEQ